MPTYVYGCDACGYRFEKSQKFSDEPIRVCPECQSTVRRIFQPAGIVFKGSGWHTTDYKRTGGDSANGTDAKSDSGKSDAKSDSGKSETKSDGGKSDAKTADSTATSGAADAAKPAQAA